jgi:Alpha amylase, catalytic domain
MPPLPRRPTVYEINTAIWLRELSVVHGRRVTFGDVPAPAWDAIAALGVHAVWFMGVWERSPEGRRVALENQGLVIDFRRALPDVTDADVLASPYCVRRYRVDERFGGPEGLATARAALAARGLSLVVDFVPNHVARDHAWVSAHPEWFIAGSDDDLAREPDAYFRAGDRVIACGRDPYFPAWSDVAQVHAFSDALRAACVDTLCDIADRADAVRCDMAMLLLGDVFARTWGERAGVRPADEFWPTVIGAVTAHAPGFRFIAEAYWDLEWTLQQQGFDYCYDKRLYDRLLHEAPESVYQHLMADAAYQEGLIRFVENHDEPRAARAFGLDRARAAAALALAAPGATLLHEGQLEARTVRVPVFLSRRPPEPPSEAMRAWLEPLVRDRAHPLFRDGRWWLCPRAGWPGDERWRALVPLAWQSPSGADRRLVVVNLTAERATGRIMLPWPDLSGRAWTLGDLAGGAAFERDGVTIAAEGLYVELPPWGVHWLTWSGA